MIRVTEGSNVLLINKVQIVYFYAVVIGRGLTILLVVAVRGVVALAMGMGGVMIIIGQILKRIVQVPVVLMRNLVADVHKK